MRSPRAYFVGFILRNSILPRFSYLLFTKYHIYAVVVSCHVVFSPHAFDVPRTGSVGSVLLTVSDAIICATLIIVAMINYWTTSPTRREREEISSDPFAYECGLSQLQVFWFATFY